MPKWKRCSYRLNNLTVLDRTPVSLQFPTAPKDFGSFTEIAEGDTISVIFEDGTRTKREELKIIADNKDSYILLFADWSCNLSDLKAIVLHTYKYE
jgi:hypothetical protein